MGGEQGLHPTPPTTLMPVPHLSPVRAAGHPQLGISSGGGFPSGKAQVPTAGLFLDIQVATKSSSAPESQLQPRTAEQNTEKLIIHCKVHLEGWWVATSLAGEGIAQVQEDTQSWPCCCPRESILDFSHRCKALRCPCEADQGPREKKVLRKFLSTPSTTSFSYNSEQLLVAML